MNRRTFLKGLIAGTAAVTLPGPLVGAEAEDRVRQFWSVGRWAEDDAALIQRLVNEAHAQGCGIVTLEPRRYHIRRPVQLPSGVWINGGWL